jgi:hypothetical protein
MQSVNSVRNQLFDVEIIAPGANTFYKNDYRYVSLAPHTEYKLKLINKHNTRCDAKVYIDNTLVGSWRIDSYSSIIIERPENTQRRFTFVGENSRTAKQTGAIAGSEDNGLVRVIFRPAKSGKYYDVPLSVTERLPRTAERNSYRSTMSRNEMNEFSDFKSKSPPRTSMARRAPSPQKESVGVVSDSRRYDAGVTVLGRDSYQRFEHTTALDTSDIDWNIVTEIVIRLVIRETGYQDYIPLSNAKNKVPPRLDGYYY